MANLKFADTHNMVTFLSKPTESDGFEQIVDFLNAHLIKYALTVNPTIYISCIEEFWPTVKAKTINGEVQLHVLVDGKKIIITESTVRRDLQLEVAEGVDCLPNSTIFEQLTLMGSKTTTWNEFSSTMAYVPQLSDPSENVADKVVHKELGDSLVMAATTASSLEAEQDSGNITKTRSNATPNESSSLGTTSGGGPRCQETMGDTVAQTRFENVSKHSIGSLLARVHDLEKTKTTQQNEIDSLKRRVKEKKFKADEDITMANVQDDVDNEMFDMNALNGEEVFVAGKNENVVEEVVDVAQVNTAATTLIITIEEITLAQALEALKTSKPKVKEIVFQEPEWDDIQAKIGVDYQLAERFQVQEQEELSDAKMATLFQQLLEKRRKHLTAKRAEERGNKPPT
ncbi:hypothetical protein Tco_0065604 [Tanacetum coccineum]